MVLRFFNIDLHVSVIEDVKTIWTHLFSNIEIVDWSISGHAHLFSHAMTDDNPILNGRTWRHFDKTLIQKFHAHFDMFLSQFDGFIVTHSPIFAMLFEKYNKPIIVVNSCRYHQPLCWSKDDAMRGLFHESLRRLASRNLLTIVHNNRADKRFFQESVPEIPTTCQYYIPSLCQYINTTHIPELDTILVDDPKNVLRDVPLSATLVRKKSPYTYKELYRHRAVVVIPREVSYMTFFEYMQACIPILLPTKRFLWELLNGYGHSLGTLQAYNMTGDLGPWIDNADYYDPEVLDVCMTFDSFQELEGILSDANFHTVATVFHERMLHRRETNRDVVYRKWKDVFHIDFFQFIHYNFWPCLARFHMDADYHDVPLATPFYKYNPILAESSIASMKPHDKIFVKTDLLPTFIATVLPRISCPFELILAVSDCSPQSFHLQLLLENPLCCHIYATNTTISHAKITAIPIGFAEPMRLNGAPSLLRHWWTVSDKSSTRHKDIDLFARHFSNTNISRMDYQNQIKCLLTETRLFANTVHLTFPTKDANELHSYLHRSRFALCLAGNGLDTHFFYECILNECVPIFMSTVDFPLYDTFKSCISIRSTAHFHTKFSTFDLDNFYKNIDWTEEKSKLFRSSYTYLR